MSTWYQLVSLQSLLESLQRTRNKLEQQNIIDNDQLDQINDEIADAVDQINTIKRESGL